MTCGLLAMTDGSLAVTGWLLAKIGRGACYDRLCKVGTGEGYLA